MLLLFCDDTIVHAIHDSTDSVTLANYPTATRIIPYEQNVDTLTKVGPAPPSVGPGGTQPPTDTRPYAPPTETTQILIDYSSQVRFNTVNKGFSFSAASGTVPVQTDRESYMLVGNTAAYAQTLAPTAMIDFTQTGTHYQLTAAEMISLFNQFSALIQQCRTLEAACIADLNSASPTILKYADVDSRFAGVTRKKA
jgi:hypothetical protein